MDTRHSADMHPAIVTVRPGAPLEVMQVPTPVPEGDEVRVRVEYTATSPLDHHQAISHLLVTPPQILGTSVAGVVVEVGPKCSLLKLGDRVFGYVFRSRKEKAHQLYCVASEKTLGKIPDGFTMKESVAVPNNFVSAWHAITADLGLELPWPKPDGFVAPQQERGDWVLLWGGGSSVGQYALQILKWYGYQNILVVAGQRQHETLKSFGAKVCISYADNDAVEQIQKIQSQTTQQKIQYLLDCVGSVKGSIEPLSKVARLGSKVAVFLPVILEAVGESKDADYSLDADAATQWPDGVEVTGIRTHFYSRNEFLAAKLQTEIMPYALSLGIIEPNKQIVIEGATLLERAENAMQLIGDKKTGGAKLVWRIAEVDEIV